MIPSDSLKKYLVDLNDHGGPAFPILIPENVDGFVSLGMLLRDAFALATLPAIADDFQSKPSHIANRAYLIADAMLDAREGKTEA